MRDQSQTTYQTYFRKGNVEYRLVNGTEDVYEYNTIKPDAQEGGAGTTFRDGGLPDGYVKLNPGGSVKTPPVSYVLMDQYIDRDWRLLSGDLQLPLSGRNFLYYQKVERFLRGLKRVEIERGGQVAVFISGGKRWRAEFPKGYTAHVYIEGQLHSYLNIETPDGIYNHVEIKVDENKNSVYVFDSSYGGGEIVELPAAKIEMLKGGYEQIPEKPSLLSAEYYPSPHKTSAINVPAEEQAALQKEPQEAVMKMEAGPILTTRTDLLHRGVVTPFKKYDKMSVQRTQQQESSFRILKTYAPKTRKKFVIFESIFNLLRPKKTNVSGLAKTEPSMAYSLKRPATKDSDVRQRPAPTRITHPDPKYRKKETSLYFTSLPPPPRPSAPEEEQPKPEVPPSTTIPLKKIQEQEKIEPQENSQEKEEEKEFVKEEIIQPVTAPKKTRNVILEIKNAIQNMIEHAPSESTEEEKPEKKSRFAKLPRKTYPIDTAVCQSLKNLGEKKLFGGAIERMFGSHESGEKIIFVYRPDGTIESSAIHTGVLEQIPYELDTDWENQVERQRKKVKKFWYEEEEEDISAAKRAVLGRAQQLETYKKIVGCFAPDSSEYKTIVVEIEETEQQLGGKFGVALQ